MHTMRRIGGTGTLLPRHGASCASGTASGSVARLSRNPRSRAKLFSRSAGFIPFSAAARRTVGGRNADGQSSTSTVGEERYLHDAQSRHVRAPRTRCHALAQRVCQIVSTMVPKGNRRSMVPNRVSASHVATSSSQPLRSIANSATRASINLGVLLRSQRCRSCASPSSHRTRAWRQRDRDR